MIVMLSQKRKREHVSAFNRVRRRWRVLGQNLSQNCDHVAGAKKKWDSAYQYVVLWVIGGNRL